MSEHQFTNVSVVQQTGFEFHIFFHSVTESIHFVKQVIIRIQVCLDVILYIGNLIYLNISKEYGIFIFKD